MLPRAGRSSPTSRRTRVLFPIPLAPTRPVRSRPTPNVRPSKSERPSGRVKPSWSVVRRTSDGRDISRAPEFFAVYVHTLHRFLERRGHPVEPRTTLPLATVAQLAPHVTLRSFRSRSRRLVGRRRHGRTACAAH